MTPSAVSAICRSASLEMMSGAADENPGASVELPMRI
jgi:hypothetical protein